ncbi:MAG: hypothetical protein RR672_06515 [Raoultibacter sp.]
MAHKLYHSMSKRQDAIDGIKAVGEYITDHADNLLGEYPSGLVRMSISVELDGSSFLCIDVSRTHVVTGREDDA